MKGNSSSVCLPAQDIMGGDTFKLCVHCLGAEQLPLRTLHSHLALFDEACRPGYPYLPVVWTLQTVGLTDRTGREAWDGFDPFSALTCRFQHSRSGDFFLPKQKLLGLSSSAEVEVLHIEAGDFEDSQPLSPGYEELLEVVTHAVA